MSDMESKMQERYDALPYLELEAEIERLEAGCSRMAVDHACLEVENKKLEAELKQANAALETVGTLRIQAERILIAELKQANAVVEAIQKFIDAQAEDEGLWCEAQYASEAYIQRGLRGCHAYIESVIKDGPRAALETDDLQDKDDGCG